MLSGRDGSAQSRNRQITLTIHSAARVERPFSERWWPGADRGFHDHRCRPFCEDARLSPMLVRRIDTGGDLLAIVPTRQSSAQ
jgi:hypothetical protein